MFSGVSGKAGRTNSTANHPKIGLSLEQLLFLIAGKRTPNLRHIVMNAELLIIQESL